MNLNFAQLLPLVTKFVANPTDGILELEKMLLPLWEKLETEAGGQITFILNKNTDAAHVTVSLYRATTPEKLNFWKAYSLPQLMDELKNLKNLELNGTSPANTIEPGTAEHIRGNIDTAAATIAANTGSEPDRTNE
jgi:hypothetical protein